MNNKKHKSQVQTTVKVCCGHSCSQRFSKYILERAEKEAQKNPEKINVSQCGCQGNCEKGPTIVVEKSGKKEIISHADPIKAAQIIKKNT